MVRESPDRRGIALCLSGGGLRATLFHLGLIKALRRYGNEYAPALSQVTDIYSVSGGSILAAHLVRNWRYYNGSDDEFARMGKEILAFAGRNVRDRVVRRWLLTRWAGKRRTYWLQKEYEQLIGKEPLARCYSDDAPKSPPRLHVLATSFRTGELCSFSRGCFDIAERANKQLSIKSIKEEQIPLSFAVAASSAFPPLFPPVALTPEMLGEPDDRSVEDTIFLSDGGVYDNFGVERFRLALNEKKSASDLPGTLIVSQAGGSFKADARRTYAGALSRNIRASDIMMRRVGESTEASLDALENFHTIRVAISDCPDDQELGVNTQRRLKLVRTDLDRFEPLLAKLLVDHGDRVTSAVLAQNGWSSTGKPPRVPSVGKVDPDRLNEVTTGASKRSYWSLMLDFRDWATTLLLWIIAGLILTGATLTVIKAIQERQAEERTRKQLEMNINEAGKRLERVRLAYLSGRKDVLERELGTAIRSTELLAENLDLKGVDAQQLTSAQARAIVEEKPSVAVPVAPTRNEQPVYVHFAGGITRAKITALNRALREAGWNMQDASGQRLESAQGRNEVRYSGNNREAAEALAKAIGAAGMTSQTVEAKELAVVGPRNLEVWISN